MKKLLGLGLIIALFVPVIAWSKIGGENVTFHPSGADPVIYQHDAHVVKAGLKCSDCHYKLYSTMGSKKKTTMPEMEKGQSCGACHNGTKAFAVTKENCKKCHK